MLNKIVHGSRSSPASLLFKNMSQARSFAFIHNLHQPPAFYVNGKKFINDFDLEEYRPQIQAFLTKRRTVKREIPPKVYILKNMGDDYKSVYHQQRLAPGEVLYDEAHMKRLYDSDVVNTQYIHSVFCEEYEKNMIENVMQKRVMNGSVPSYLDKPKHDDINKQSDELVRTFYQGDRLTPLEYDIERMYISEKMQKNVNYQRQKSFRFKVKWTVSDLNRYQDQRNYRMNDMEYFSTTKPRFEPFDLDQALSCMRTHQDIQGTTRLRRWLSYFTDEKNFERGQRRSVMQSNTLL